MYRVITALPSPSASSKQSVYFFSASVALI